MPLLGWVFAIAMAIAAFVVHAMLTARGISNVPNAAILAILLGAIARNVLPLSGEHTAGMAKGWKRIVKSLIPPAIVCMGAGLDLKVLTDPNVGLAGIFIIITSMMIAFGSAFLCSRLLGLTRGTATLLGAGTAICGNSAIVAVAPLVKSADENDLALSLGSVNLLGVVVMLAIPPIAMQTALGDHAVGAWAGTTVHAVPQAIAAGDAVSPAAGEFATLFKLVRVALLAPLVVIVATVTHRHHHAKNSNNDGAHEEADTSTNRKGFFQLIPWFVWGFIAMALINTLGWLTWNIPVSEWLHETGEVSTLLKSAGRILLTIALAAIGLELNLRSLLGIGARALLAAALSSAILLAASYVMIRVLM